MHDIRKEKGRIISILHLYADRDVHACTGIFSFDWDENYGVTIEYPFFAIGEIVPCWVQAVESGDKSCTLKLVNYDSRIFD